MISADWTEFSCAEQNNGYSYEAITGPDEYELTYLSDPNLVGVVIDGFIESCNDSPFKMCDEYSNPITRVLQTPGFVLNYRPNFLQEPNP